MVIIFNNEIFYSKEDNKGPCNSSKYSNKNKKKITDITN